MLLVTWVLVEGVGQQDSSPRQWSGVSLWWGGGGGGRVVLEGADDDDDGANYDPRPRATPGLKGYCCVGTSRVEGERSVGWGEGQP